MHDEDESLDDFSFSVSVAQRNLKTDIEDLKRQKKENEDLLKKTTDEGLRKILRDRIAGLKDDLDRLQQNYDEMKTAAVCRVEDQIIDFILNQCGSDYYCFIAADNAYMHISDYSTVPVQVNLKTTVMRWNEMKFHLADRLNNGAISAVTQNIIFNAFRRAERVFNIQTASFHYERWNGRAFNVMNVLRRFWVPVDGGTDYDPIIDDLIYSICGGKQENIDHLETWVAYKYLFPERVVSIPGLSCSGVPGGNGKTMLGMLMRTVFTPLGVGPVKAKALTGGFNKGLENKVVAILDDEKEDGFPQDELKSSAGNITQTVEPKGRDAYTVDTTHNFLVLDNTGAVKLVGGGSGGEDRRWSVIYTEIVLLDYMKEKYGLDTTAAQARLQQLAAVVQNRVEVGRWVAAMIERHSVRDMVALSPLHGQDYLERIQDQKDQWTEIFEDLLPIIEREGIMPGRFLEEIIAVRTGVTVKDPKQLNRRFGEFLSRMGHKNSQNKHLRVVVTWGGQRTPDRMKCRRIRPDATTFDYGLISSEPFVKERSLTRDSLSIRDFDGATVQRSRLVYESKEND